jgi:hypothetical protein
MDDNPVAIFERLLSQEPGPRNVHHLKASRDFYDRDWTNEDVEAIEAEFARDFRTVAAQVEAVWGAPDFIGHRSESEFPEFYTVEDFCYWRNGNRLAMIWWEHQDKELPVILTLAVMTPEQIT